MKGILLNPDTYELELSSNTLSIGSTDEQNAQLILLTNQGEWKEYPVLGAGLIRFVRSNTSDLHIQRQVKLQLSLDNITPKTLEVQNHILTLEL